MPGLLALARLARVPVVAEILAALLHVLRERRDAGAAVFGYQTNDSSATARAFSLVSLQCTIVNVAACLLTNLPTGSVQSAEPAAVVRDALLEVLGRDADGERQQADAVLADLVVAVEARRRAPDRRVRLLQRLRVHAALRHRPVLAVELVLVVASRCRRCGSSASSHISRVSCGSMPKPSISARVDERPVPNSTRPSLTRSSTATLSAVRIGWLYGFGSSRTP